VIGPAEADLEDGARWHEAERARLSAQFLSDVDRTVSRIAERPLQFPLSPLSRFLRRRVFLTEGHSEETKWISLVR
jgi:hypothetical protein